MNRNRYKFTFFLCCFILCLALASMSARAALIVKPAEPLTEAGGEIRLSVKEAVGQVMWTADKGRINGSFQGAGAAVTYTAPAVTGIDTVTLQDAANQIETFSIIVLPAGDMAKHYAPENVRWDVPPVGSIDIYALLLSRDGSVLWAGRSNGLEKRDPLTGRLLRMYTEADGLPGKWVKSLADDGAGGLWAGTSAGLARLDADGSWTVYDQSNSSLPDSYIMNLVFDHAGGLWIQFWTYTSSDSGNSGFARLDTDGIWTVYDQSNSGLSDYIQTLAADDMGGLWVGTSESGLARLSADGNWTIYNTGNSGLPDNKVRALVVDSAGGLWAGTWGGGLAHLDADGSWTIYHAGYRDSATDKSIDANSGLPTNLIDSLALDGAGGLWAGTYAGLAHFGADKTWTVYTQSNSALPHDWIDCLAVDGAGGLWIAANYNLFIAGQDNPAFLVRLGADETWTIYDQSNSGFPSNTVWGLISDNMGGMWIGASHGLARLASDGVWATYDSRNTGLPVASVLSLLSDGAGGMWAGTDGGGLAKLAPDGIWTLYHAGQNWDVSAKRYGTPANSGLPSNYINSLAIDGTGELWTGTSGGLARMNTDGSWTVYDQSNSGLPNNHVQDITIDRADTLWTGTEDGGLAGLSVNGVWRVYNTENSGLPNNDVRSLATDGQGGLWAGTYGNGLARLNADGSWSVYNTDNSALPDNYVNMLAADSNGGLWAGTGSYLTQNGGLARLSADGAWTIYNTASLPDYLVEEFVLDDANGLWIDTLSGLVHLDANGVWTEYNEKNSDLLNIGSFAVDESGGVWAGGHSALSRLNADGIWKVYHGFNTGLRYAVSVEELAIDEAGTLWAATGDGLARLDTDGFWTVYHAGRNSFSDAPRYHLPANSGLPDGNLRNLAIGIAGELWASTLDSGLVRLDADGSWTVYHAGQNWDPDTQQYDIPANSALPSNDIQDLAVDEAGDLWAATWNGLARLHADETWTIYNTANSALPGNAVNSIVFDDTGGLWVSTYYGGLRRLDADGTWSAYNISDSGLPDNNVGQLTLDDAGALWMTSYGNGLARLDAGRNWTVYNKSNSGLPDGYAWRFAVDSAGRLWAGNNGLARLGFLDDDKLALARQTGNSALLTDRRAAIVIHPQGSEVSGRDISSIAFMAAYAYRGLEARGYIRDEIYFLSAVPDMDIDGDGRPDDATDAPVKLAEFRAGTPRRDLTLDDLRTAFAWAALQGTLDQPLLVIFTGHGESDHLLLDANGTTLTALELDALLDSYQENTGNPVVAILEAGHSGTFIPVLSGNNRLIITSADTERAYYDDLGTLSFTRIYFDKLRDMNKNRSFSKVFRETSAEFSGADSIFRRQRPLLDDNGDGIADSLDGAFADSLCLNGCIGGLSGVSSEMTLTPETSAQTVAPGQKVTLAVRTVITNGLLQSVRAVILTPEAEILRSAHGFSLVPSVSVPLSMDPADPERWSGTFSDFTYRGNYVVKFLAEDRDGFLGPDASVTLTQEQGPETPVAPVPNLKRVRNGNILRVNLPFTQGEDIYAGVALPDGRLYLLDDFNSSQLFDGSLPRWNGGGALLEISIAPWMPHGEYQLYMLRLPAGMEPWSNREQWLPGVSSFTVE